MAENAIVTPFVLEPSSLIDSNSMSEQLADVEDFDPARHLAFMPPSKVYTMKELDFAEDVGVSPIAVSEPFSLFTQVAIERMRAEIMSNKVWENCQYSSNLAQCQLRGFAAQ